MPKVTSAFQRKICWQVWWRSGILSQPMKSKARALLLALLFCSLFIFGQEVEGAGAVSFSKGIAPILAKKCVACHGPEKSKGHFRLDSFELLMKAGESKSASVVHQQLKAVEAEMAKRTVPPHHRQIGRAHV